MTLTERIAATVGKPATDDAFDIHAALDELLGGIGLSAADAGGRITFTGADPVVPSPLRLGGAAALATTSPRTSASDRPRCTRAGPRARGYCASC
jgi:hypothetical protein